MNKNQEPNYIYQGNGEFTTVWVPITKERELAFKRAQIDSWKKKSNTRNTNIKNHDRKY